MDWKQAEDLFEKLLSFEPKSSQDLIHELLGVSEALTGACTELKDHPVVDYLSRIARELESMASHVELEGDCCTSDEPCRCRGGVHDSGLDIWADLQASLVLLSLDRLEDERSSQRPLRGPLRAGSDLDPLV